MLSPLLSTPSIRMASIVVPWPSIILTSITVQLNSSFYTIFLLMKVDVYLTMTDSKSGIPSPVTPDVGTIGTYSLGFMPSQYIATLNFCSLSSVMTFYSLESKSTMVVILSCF